MLVGPDRGPVLLQISYSKDIDNSLLYISPEPLVERVDI